MFIADGTLKQCKISITTRFNIEKQETCFPYSEFRSTKLKYTSFWRVFHGVPILRRQAASSDFTKTALSHGIATVILRSTRNWRRLKKTLKISQSKKKQHNRRPADKRWGPFKVRTKKTIGTRPASH